MPLKRCWFYFTTLFIAKLQIWGAISSDDGENINSADSQLIFDTG